MTVLLDTVFAPDSTWFGKMWVRTDGEKNGKKFNIGKLLGSLILGQNPQTYQWTLISIPLFSVCYVPFEKPFQRRRGVISLCCYRVDTLFQSSRKLLTNFKGVFTFSDIWNWRLCQMQVNWKLMSNWKEAGPLVPSLSYTPLYEMVEHGLPTFPPPHTHSHQLLDGRD